MTIVQKMTPVKESHQRHCPQPISYLIEPIKYLPGRTLRPDGLISARSLRAEIAAGRLAGHRIAGRLLVSDEDIAAYLDRARVGGPVQARQKPAKPPVAAVRSAAITPQPKPAIPGPLAAAAAALTKRRRAG